MTETRAKLVCVSRIERNLSEWKQQQSAKLTKFQTPVTNNCYHNSKKRRWRQPLNFLFSNCQCSVDGARDVLRRILRHVVVVPGLAYSLRVSLLKISSGWTRALRQNQRIIRCG